MKVKYYIRYVDDFIILDPNKNLLKKYRDDINQFLRQILKIELHPDKSKIICLSNRLNFLGFRVFYYHKLLKKSNIRKMKNKFKMLKGEYDKSYTDYDVVYDFFEGWYAYAKHANTYKLRKKLFNEIEKNFPNEISTKEIDRMSKKVR